MKTFCETGNGIGEKLTRSTVDIVQMNIGYTCNLACKHCHVQAGPTRSEQMSAETMRACLKFINESQAATVDITGGAPELNPHLPLLIAELRKITTVKRILVRTNMTLLDKAKYKHLINLFKTNKIELVGSLPCYGEENVNVQRGDGVFASNIRILKLLNSVGYGRKGTGLILDLVYNPGGAFLPGPQTALQAAYKDQLQRNFGIEFNHLFTITNAPGGRFKEYLKKTGEFDSYMKLLIDNFNKDNLKRVMCASQVNIGWDGSVYDCDFNQALGMRVGSPKNIADFTPSELLCEILTDDHCYCCTAGAGSSCQGSLA